MNFGVAWVIYTPYYTMKITFRYIYIYMYINMFRHIDLFSLLYTYKCTHFLSKFMYINIHLRTHTHTHVYMYIYIYITCLENLNKLAGECSIALSQTIGQSLQRSLIMAKNKRARIAKNKRHQKTPVAQGRRDLLGGDGHPVYF